MLSTADAAPEQQPTEPATTETPKTPAEELRAWCAGKAAAVEAILAVAQADKDKVEVLKAQRAALATLRGDQAPGKKLFEACTNKDEVKGDLAALAEKIKTNHQLALALWETGNLDARLLAILLIKPAGLSRAELDRLVRSAR